MKTIGVLLCGCGVFDGAEVHESVLTLLNIEKLGAKPRCMAPDVEQHHVINHLSGEEMNEKRNVLVESARIARGDIEDVAGVSADDLDALIIPGGFGAAKNLCTFAIDGADATVHPEVARLVREMHESRKPIGLLCIAPAVGAKVLGEYGVTLTIGTDADTAAGLEKCGAKHAACTVEGIVEDPEHKVVSTPAFMLGQSVSEVAEGIERLVETVVDWTR